ncbi:MAG TPA: TetR/AcrR family transcriptional regulator [Acidimicrobiia bacterium]|nr:TetR/AcrR family transcriptional regulator [Acidimicrobiia bacterium]
MTPPAANAKKRDVKKPPALSIVGGTPAQERTLRSQGKQTLRRLLEAALVVFEKRGYHAARVDDICRVAKTSHGTFYLYFSSKEELFRALVAGTTESMVELAGALPRLTPDREGYDALVAWLNRFTDLYDEQSALLRTWTEAEVVDSELGQVGGDLVNQFARELTARVRAAVPDLDARVAALALVAMIERATYYLETRQIRVGRAELVTTLAGVTHAALFGADACDRTTPSVTATSPPGTPVLRS